MERWRARRWQLVADWRYTSHDKDLIVHKGFIFDGASVPRLLWNVIPPTGYFLIAALVHDYGYKMGTVNRHSWDDILYEVAIETKVWRPAALLIWSMVRLFGWVAWNRHRRADRRKA